MPMTDKERLDSLYRRIKLRREKEDGKNRSVTETAKEVERMEK